MTDQRILDTENPGSLPGGGVGGVVNPEIDGEGVSADLMARPSAFSHTRRSASELAASRYTVRSTSVTVKRNSSLSPATSETWGGLCIHHREGDCVHNLPLIPGEQYAS